MHKTDAHPCPPMNNNIAPMPTYAHPWTMTSHPCPPKTHGYEWAWAWAPNVGLCLAVDGDLHLRPSRESRMIYFRNCVLHSKVLRRRSWMSSRELYWEPTWMLSYDGMNDMVARLGSEDLCRRFRFERSKGSYVIPTSGFSPPSGTTWETWRWMEISTSTHLVNRGFFFFQTTSFVQRDWGGDHECPPGNSIGNPLGCSYTMGWTINPFILQTLIFHPSKVFFPGLPEKFYSPQDEWMAWMRYAHQSPTFSFKFVPIHWS